MNIVNSFSFSQTIQQVHFFGFHLKEYSGPCLIAVDTYKPLHKNIKNISIQGRIIIDESIKNFKIKWINSDEWNCNYEKKEIKNENDPFLGNIINTQYLGKWEDSKKDCMLEITFTKSQKCIITIYSGKIIDDEYKINTWKKIFTFSINECLN